MEIHLQPYGQNGQWLWHLKADNGEILCQAHGFNSPRIAKENIMLVCSYFRDQHQKDNIKIIE